MVKFRKQYLDYEPDFEEFSGEYIVDDTGYESLTDLLSRCIRDRVSIPERSPGLVDDYEFDEFGADFDQVLFPEDYRQESEPAILPENVSKDNIKTESETKEQLESETKE